MPTIKTFTGIKFDVLNFDKDSIRIEDIAHALSLTTRYGGHCHKLYSVAQHSVWCAKYKPTKKYQLYCLLHDAAEAYLGDIVSPVKHQLPEFMKIEDALLDIILEKFCGGVMTPEIHKEVKIADIEALHFEQSILWDPVQSKKHCWTALKAEREFLNTYNRLVSK